MSRVRKLAGNFTSNPLCPGLRNRALHTKTVTRNKVSTGHQSDQHLNQSHGVRQSLHNNIYVKVVRSKFISENRANPHDCTLVHTTLYSLFILVGIF